MNDHSRQPFHVAGDDAGSRVPWRMRGRLVPVTKKALRRVTTTEPSRVKRSEEDVDWERHHLHARLKEISSFPSTMISGKFWSTDSDSEYEDLGDADQLSKSQKSFVRSLELSGITGPVQGCDELLTSKMKMKKGASPGPRIRWPWMKPWRGPLPKNTPSALTLDDIVVHRESHRHRQPTSESEGTSKGRLIRDPPFPHRNSNDGGPRITGPRAIGLRPTQSLQRTTPGVNWLRLQLANPSSWAGRVSGDRRTFAQVAMAGSRGLAANYNNARPANNGGGLQGLP